MAPLAALFAILPVLLRPSTCLRHSSSSAVSVLEEALKGTPGIVVSRCGTPSGESMTSANYYDDVSTALWSDAGQVWCTQPLRAGLDPVLQGTACAQTPLMDHWFYMSAASPAYSLEAQLTRVTVGYIQSPDGTSPWFCAKADAYLPPSLFKNASGLYTFQPRLLCLSPEAFWKAGLACSPRDTLSPPCLKCDVRKVEPCGQESDCTYGACDAATGRFCGEFLKRDEAACGMTKTGYCQAGSCRSDPVCDACKLRICDSGIRNSSIIPPDVLSVQTSLGLLNVFFTRQGGTFYMGLYSRVSQYANVVYDIRFAVLTLDPSPGNVGYLLKNAKTQFCANIWGDISSGTEVEGVACSNSILQTSSFTFSLLLDPSTGYLFRMKVTGYPLCLHASGEDMSRTFTMPCNAANEEQLWTVIPLKPPSMLLLHKKSGMCLSMAPFFGPDQKRYMFLSPCDAQDQSQGWSLWAFTGYSWGWSYFDDSVFMREVCIFSSSVGQVG